MAILKKNFDKYGNMYWETYQIEVKKRFPKANVKTVWDYGPCWQIFDDLTSEAKLKLGKTRRSRKTAWKSAYQFIIKVESEES